MRPLERFTLGLTALLIAGSMDVPEDSEFTLRVAIKLILIAALGICGLVLMWTNDKYEK